MLSKKRMMTFLVVNVIFNMAASFAHPVTPTLFKSLNMPSYLFGYALASMMIVNFLFSPFWGKMNSFISSRVSLIIACTGYALGQLFFALAQTELQFIIARMFAGLFTGGTFVSILNYVINMSPDEKSRGVYLTASATIQSVGGAFGYFVGGMLGSIDVRLALGAQVTVLFLSGIAFFFVCGNDAQAPLSELKIKQVVKEANPFAAFVASGKFMTVTLAFLFVMCVMQNLGQTSFDQSFNYYIADIFSFPSSYNGMLKAAMGLITLIANSTICAYLIKRTNVRKSVIGVFALCTATMTTIVFITSVVPFLAINVAFYAFSAVSMPLLQNLAADAAKGKDSNLVMGFYNSMKSLGGIFGAVFAGTFYTMNPKYPFVCALIAFGLATLFGIAYYKKSSAQSQAQEAATSAES